MICFNHLLSPLLFHQKNTFASFISTQLLISIASANSQSERRPRMGNCVGKMDYSESCRVRVLRWEGDECREEFMEPCMKVQQVMTENPLQILCKLSHVEKGRRIRPMPGQHQLELGSIYIMLPLQKLGSVLSASDISAILSASSLSSCSDFNSNSNHTTVFPDGDCIERMDLSNNTSKNSNGSGSGSSFCCVDGEEVDFDVEDDDILGLFQYAFCRGKRPWRPSLETIDELFEA